MLENKPNSPTSSLNNFTTNLPQTLSRHSTSIFTSNPLAHSLQTTQPQAYQKFTNNLLTFLQDLKKIDVYGDQIFSLMHQIRDKLDDAEDIKLMISDEEEDQDLLETKTKLKALLRHNLLIPEITSKLEEIDARILLQASQEQEKNKTQNYANEVADWIAQIAEKIKTTKQEIYNSDQTMKLETFKYLKIEYEKLASTTLQKENTVLDNLLEFNPTFDLQEWETMKISISDMQQELDQKIEILTKFENLMKNWQFWLESVENVSTSVSDLSDHRIKILKEVELENLISELANFSADQQEMESLYLPKVGESNQLAWSELKNSIQQWQADFATFTAIKQDLDSGLKSVILAIKNLPAGETDSSIFSDDSYNFSNTDSYNLIEIETTLVKYTNLADYFPNSSSNSFLPNFLNFYLKNLNIKLAFYQSKVAEHNLHTEFSEKLQIFQTILNDDYIKDIDIIEQEFNLINDIKYEKFTIPETITCQMCDKLESIKEYEAVQNSIFNFEKVLKFDLETIHETNESLASVVENLGQQQQGITAEFLETQLETLSKISFTPVNLTTSGNSQASTSILAGSSNLPTIVQGPDN